MKVLVVEDEKYARTHLLNMLTEIDTTIEVVASFDTVSETVEWLPHNNPDLIFLDIQLADGLSFSIFEKIEVNHPIIFTTAFDQYTLKAFKVNSIDYLLKPIEKAALEQSIQKFYKINTNTQLPDFKELIRTLKEPKKEFQERFMVNRGEKLLSITVDKIAYFEGEDRYVFLHTHEGSRYIINYKLADLEALLDPKYFFRLNRSFITHFKAIDRIINLSTSRIKVDLKPQQKRDITVSFANSKAFKQWLNQ